jgi:Ketopantoate reductase
MESVLFLGMGAVGITFASQFVDAGHPVQFLCDEKRREKYRKQDLSVNGRPYAFSFVVPSEISEAPDFVLVAVKEYQLESALDLLEGVAGPRTIVLSLLNGIDSEETIAGRLGGEKSFLLLSPEWTRQKKVTRWFIRAPARLFSGRGTGKDPHAWRGSSDSWQRPVSFTRQAVRSCG